MRFLGVRALAFVLVLLGCAGPQVIRRLEPAASPTVAAATAAQYPPGGPVVTRDDAIAVALQSRAIEGFQWTEPPRAALVEEMSYAEARAMIGRGDDEGTYRTVGRETRVWFVIFQGKWILEPMGPTGAAPIAYEGCLLTVLTSRDGTILAMGDSLCPGG